MEEQEIISLSPASAFMKTEITNMPQQEAIDGIKFDFNDGVRIRTPISDKKWKLVVENTRTGFIICDSIIKGKEIFTYPLRYYNTYHIEIYRCSDEGIPEEKPAFVHDFNLKNQNVLFFINIKDAYTTGLGDTIAWCAAITQFQKIHQCNVDVVTQDVYGITSIIRKHYPKIKFIDFEQYKEKKYYATYYTLVYLNHPDYENSPISYKWADIETYTRYLLGLEGEKPFHLDLREASSKREIKGKYVCIATKSTAFMKLWNYPKGWETIVSYLKEKGYRVLCIDKNREEDFCGNIVGFPEGAEDFTNIGLERDVQLLSHCDFFIGLPSGLSWLARSCGAKVILISGFSNPFSEFWTPYRVQNYMVCNSCWNRHDFLWSNDFKVHCPSYNDDPSKAFICTRAITPKMVINQIDRILKK